MLVQVSIEHNLLDGDQEYVVSQEEASGALASGGRYHATRYMVELSDADGNVSATYDVNDMCDVQRDGQVLTITRRDGDDIAITADTSEDAERLGAVLRAGMTSRGQSQTTAIVEPVGVQSDPGRAPVVETSPMPQATSLFVPQHQPPIPALPASDVVNPFNVVVQPTTIIQYHPNEATRAWVRRNSAMVRIHRMVVIRTVDTGRLGSHRPDRHDAARTHDDQQGS